MLAFKGFTKDLTCIRGEGIFRYEPGVLYTADKSKCARTGFHCTENPLEYLPLSFLIAAASPLPHSLRFFRSPKAQ